VKAIARLLDGQIQDRSTVIENPEEVIRLIGNCRIVVTGSYHAGVFALAQGIPVVALFQSAYYEQKFMGVEQQFPGGCRTIDLRRPTACNQIEEQICHSWESAEQIREPLLRAAARQIELGHAAYKAAHELIPLQRK